MTLFLWDHFCSRPVCRQGLCRFFFIFFPDYRWLIFLISHFDRELSKKAQKANNVWWRLSGLLGDQNRLFMYILLQAMFTVATMALTVPIFLSYELHVTFQILKVSASVWNGGNFLLEVMPRQVILKEKKRTETQPVDDQSTLENSMKSNSSSEVIESQQLCMMKVSGALMYYLVTSLFISFSFELTWWFYDANWIDSVKNGGFRFLLC